MRSEVCRARLERTGQSSGHQNRRGAPSHGRLEELLVTEIKHTYVTYGRDMAIHALSHRLLTTHETVLAPQLKHRG